MFADSISQDFYGFAIAKLTKLGKIVGVMQEADHPYSVLCGSTVALLLACTAHSLYWLDSLFIYWWSQGS